MAIEPPVTEKEKATLAKLCQDAGGPTQAASRLGLNVFSVLRIVSGLPVRRGTVALLRQALARAAMETPTKTKEA